MKRHLLGAIEGACGQHLIALAFIGRGEALYDFSTAKPSKAPTYQTIQIGWGEHVLEDGLLSYMNHSCDPNVFVDTQARCCYALRDIYPADELTFFYPSTEWNLAQPFECLCGHPKCIAQVVGANAVPETILGRYKINGHILARLVAG